MPQVFSVGIDEEVNSVIGKIRKTTATRIALIVAQRALILQSSISLQLIKSEADKLKKKIMIVTKDEEGLAVAKRIGFIVKKTMENVERSVDYTQQKINKKSEYVNDNLNNDNNLENIADKKNRLQKLGSDNFVSVSGIIKRPNVDDKNETKKKKYFGDKHSAKKENSSGDRKFLFENDKVRENDFNDLFANVNNNKNNNENEKKQRNRKRSKTLTMILIVLLISLGFVGYLFFPKANIKIKPQNIQKETTLSVLAKEDVSQEYNVENSNEIAVKINSVKKSDFISLTYKATGSKNSSNQKARGIITIYNNYSEASQILVATTRFLSENGKLFRLVKSVVVPGMSTENGENKPGEVKAEVIADQSGEDFNINPTTFKIPGFEGSPKYDKFYAKSESVMKGGGNGEGELKIVSKSDIEMAKKDAEEKLKAKIKKEIEDSIGSDNIVLDDAIDFEVVDSAVFPEEGSIADSFEYQIKVNSTALYFSENELNQKLKEYIENNFYPKDYQVKIVDINKNYGEVYSDFKNKTLKISLKLDILLRSEINKEEIKRELLGKGQRQIDAVVGRHPEIKELEAEITPSVLANKIPKYYSRVTINIVDD